jgi:formate dehydrogenase subunit delta
METRDTVRMANQIGDFFKSYPEADAIDGIAEHINKFWEPRMRASFFSLLDAGGEGLSQIVKKSAAKIKRPKLVA